MILNIDNIVSGILTRTNVNKFVERGKTDYKKKQRLT